MSYLTHFCCESEQLGRYAILTQSPTHAKAIAEKIGAEAVSKGDLYHIYTGNVGGQAVSVISCGIGSPAAALAPRLLAERLQMPLERRIQSASSTL